MQTEIQVQGKISREVHGTVGKTLAAAEAVQAHMESQNGERNANRTALYTDVMALAAVAATVASVDSRCLCTDNPRSTGLARLLSGRGVYRSRSRTEMALLANKRKTET